MLQNIDHNKLNQLMCNDDEIQQIISQLLENHHSILSSVAHEIRNPLTLISSSLQLIELQHPETKDFYGWKQLIEDVDFIRLLLDDLTTFNNGHTLCCSTFSMEYFLKNISISFAMANEFQNSKIEYTSCIPSSLGTFYGDKIKLGEVILNLLRNAIEAIDNYGTIQLSATRSKKTLTIKIQDTGCGIPEEQIDTIFEPFVTHKPNGTGLGLAISKKIIESHNGTITAESEYGNGTCFTICLPT